jgi:hypothetical protein
MVYAADVERDVSLGEYVRNMERYGPYRRSEIVEIIISSILS